MISLVCAMYIVVSLALSMSELWSTLVGGVGVVGAPNMHLYTATLPICSGLEFFVLYNLDPVAIRV